MGRGKPWAGRRAQSILVNDPLSMNREHTSRDANRDRDAGSGGVLAILSMMA
jgi:hypothetical protein